MVGNARMGESKSVIVEEYGSPERTWRASGKDYWYYNARSNHPEERMILVFENGNLVEKVRPGASTKFDALEADLEKLSREKSTKGKFQTLSD